MEHVKNYDFRLFLAVFLVFKTKSPLFTPLQWAFRYSFLYWFYVHFLPADDPLTTLWRRQTKSSPIFAKILQLFLCGTLNSELFEFLRYLYPFQRYAKFSFSGFFNSAGFFKIIFSRKLHCLKNFLCWIQIR